MTDEKPRIPGTGKPTPGDVSIGSFAGAGLQFAVSLVVFLLLGQWIDRKLGTSPLFLLVGVFIGGAAAFYSMYRRLAAVQKADDDARRNK